MLLKQESVRDVFNNNKHQYNTKIPVFKTKVNSLEEMG